jgi:hypothetical protein
MNKTVKNTDVKTSRVSVRLTEDMYKLFAMIAEEQKLTVPKFLRDAGLILAEMSSDEKEILSLIKDKDKLKAMKNIHSLIIETKDTLVSGNHQLYDRLFKKIDRVEKLVYLFLYSYFFHTPEVKVAVKDEARKSAKTRQEGVLELLEDMMSEADG